MCPNLYNKAEEFKTKFEEMGINCDNQSDWYKTNTELRLVANTIKHGEGRSSQQLQAIRPEYFDTNSSYLTDSKIEITHQDIQSYIKHMKLFWDSFFESFYNNQDKSNKSEEPINYPAGNLSAHFKRYTNRRSNI